jgi:hypothetical protein
MRALLISVLMLLPAARAAAQSADCPPPPAAAGPTLPLALDLAGRPGVPSGVTGQAYLDVPLGTPDGYACDDSPPPVHDILRGPPGDVLGGPPSADLLRGPGSPHVEVEVLPK